MVDLESEIKELIVSSLHLEDLAPADLDSNERLFGEGLGLDSIDALELGVALRKRYGIKIEAVTDEVKQHFQTVASLARFIQAQRGSNLDAVG